MSERLKGKSCIIVGGTSGIGLATARRFLEEGASLAIAGLPDGQGEPAWTRLQPMGRVAYFPCDARDPVQVESLFREALAFLGGLDALYHVAGSSGRRHGDGPLHECSLDGWQATLDANLKTVFLTNRLALRHFLDHGRGVILNMASVLAFSPSSRHFDAAAYAAAKGGIIAMSRLAAASYAGRGIRVNVLAPGLIDTPMAQRAASDPAIMSYLRSKQPLRSGPGLPEDCADAAVFLCSDEACFITGAVLPVDGGWSLSEGATS
jgi:NAD(P)-dependent dehydrogenase (short-subunit alcohol dehydrogenase family)